MFTKIADGIRALDAAMKTGVGVADAFKALKALDVSPETPASIERSVHVYEEARTACRINSFPGGIEVVLAGGGRKAIRDVRCGDRLLATDPTTGRTRGEPVTRTFSHSADDLLDIVLAKGGSLTSTPGHQVYVAGRGWTPASDLRAGDSLRTPDGTLRTVAAVRDRSGATPRTVYDLTVSGLHTFYAVAGNTPVLVHNCNDIVFDGDQFPGLAHTLTHHVQPNRAQAEALAAKKTEDLGKGTPNSVFTNQETAQKVVDHALADQANRISRWMRENKTNELTWTGNFGAPTPSARCTTPTGRRPGGRPRPPETGTSSSS
ncbi:polymorphic toxin-type HINT domain-containing protein [Streptomyces luteogriseus]|uniref:polymorphic toxin-type HINT domain-containing protein n=1 Tax=Streptomyces luteogriseus TaxID=68233 RepID=UPI0037F28550